MKQNLKKALSVLLISILIISLLGTSLNVSVFAERITRDNDSLIIRTEENKAVSINDVYANDDEISDSFVENVGENSLNISRAEWLHELVTTFNINYGDSLPDNYYTDVSAEHKYYLDILKAESAGLIDVEAGLEMNPDSDATREFAAHTLNMLLGYIPAEEYTFADIEQLKYADDAAVAIEEGWFTKKYNYFMPNEPITLSEKNRMLSLANKIVEKSKIDTTKESEIIFKDDVIVIPDEVEVERNNIYDENKNIVSTELTVANLPEEFIIKVNDLFAVFYGELAVGYKAVNVTKDGDNTIINAVKADDSDIYSSYSIGGSVDVDMKNIVPEDNVEMAFYDAANDVEYESLEDVPEYELVGGKKVNINVQPVFKKEIEIKDGIKLNVKFEILNPTVEYDIDVASHANVELNFQAKTTVECDVDEKVFDGTEFIPAVPIAWVEVPGVGALSVVTDINISGYIKAYRVTNYTYGLSAIRGGRISYWKDINEQNPIIEANVTFTAGLSIRFTVSELPVLKGHAEYNTGIKSVVRYVKYGDGKLPEYCLNCSTWVYANIEIEAEADFFGVYSVPLMEERHEIFNDVNSPVKVAHHVEDGIEVTHCARENDSKSPGFGYNSRGYRTKSTSKYAGITNRGLGGYAINEATGVSEPVFTYTCDAHGNATITGCSGGYGALNIPGEIDGHTVVAIGDRAFSGKTGIVNVVIPDSVTKIGDYAFLECINMTSVKLSKNLTTLEAGAFARCRQITSIEIPKSLKSVGCYSNTETGGAFSSCDKLKTVIFEKEITTIPANLFRYCGGIEKVVIPETVTVIGDSAFHSCVNMKEVNIQDYVTSIGTFAFAYCNKLEKIEIPDSVTKIGEKAFLECINMTNVKLSKNLTTLEAGAFARCRQITSIEIPKSLKSVGCYSNTETGGAFSSCDKLKTVIFEKGITTIPANLFRYCGGIEKVVIPETVTVIGDSAFHSCVNMKEVNIQDYVTSIGTFAFAYCNKLEKIEIPDSVTKIGEKAFLECINMTNVKLSKNLTSLEAGAFARCSQMTSIEIPKSLKSVGCYSNTETGGVFSSCNKLKTVTFEEGMTTIPADLFRYCSGIERITIPDTVKVIGYSAFYNCNSLKEIDIPDNVETLGEYAFHKCDSMEKATIGKGIKIIPEHAFSECRMLETVKISEPLTALKDRSFQYCSRLKEVGIPNSVNDIGIYVFEGCTALEKVHLPEIRYNITEGVFKNCTALKEINIPETLTTIHKQAFYNCDSLEEFTPSCKELTEIKDYAFYDCDGLKTVKLPDTVTTM